MLTLGTITTETLTLGTITPFDCTLNSSVRLSCGWCMYGVQAYMLVRVHACLYLQERENGSGFYLIYFECKRFVLI